MENKRNNDSEIIKYKGVRKRKWGKWVSEIRLPNSRERIWLGSYDSPVKAARAFDAAQFCLRGKSANFNFPDNPPDISGGRSMTPSEIQAAASRFANTVPDPDLDPSSGTSRVDPVMEENNSLLSYSPSISDGTTVEIEMDGLDMSGVETSFHEQLSLSTQLGSGNFASDFGCFTGFNDFNYREFYTLPQTDNFDYGCDDQDNQDNQDDSTYNASCYQDSYLWNF